MAVANVIGAAVLAHFALMFAPVEAINLIDDD